MTATAIGFDASSGALVIARNNVFPARTLIAYASATWPDRIQIDSLAGRGEQTVAWFDVRRLDPNDPWQPSGMVEALAYVQGEFAKRKPVGATVPQSAPATTWTLVHALDFVPSVTLVDTAGDVFEADVRHVNETTILVTLSAPTAGTAYLS